MTRQRRPRPAQSGVTPLCHNEGVNASGGDEPADVVLTAMYVTDDGHAVYAREVLTLQKDLMRAGFRVEFDYPPERRVYRRLKSAVSEQVVPFAVDLAAGGLILLIQWLAGVGGDRKVKVTASRTRRKGRKDQTTETLTYEGPASAAAEVVLQWKKDADADAE